MRGLVLINDGRLRLFIKFDHVINCQDTSNFRPNICHSTFWRSMHRSARPEYIVECVPSLVPHSTHVMYVP